jgi:probable rRNA maturation factor
MTEVTEETMPEDPGLSAAGTDHKTGSKASDGTVLSELCPVWREEIPGIDHLTTTAVDAVFKIIGSLDVPPEISIVFSDDARVRELNRDYRGLDKSTNVLSFGLGQDEAPAVPGFVMLGDVVLAFETVRSEAISAGKSIENHTCHLIVHGVLHLLGYDHEDDGQADEMEALEKRILATLDIDDPYQLPDERGAA